MLKAYKSEKRRREQTRKLEKRERDERRRIKKDYRKKIARHCRRAHIHNRIFY